jgi:hypothetical protein
MRELIMDHGTEFGGNRNQENGNPNGRFKKHLEELGIKPIPLFKTYQEDMVFTSIF